MLCNAPMGNESPIHRQCDQLHPEGENEVWQVKQELELDLVENNKKEVNKERSEQREAKENRKEVLLELKSFICANLFTSRFFK